MSTATLLPAFQDLIDGPGELGPVDDGKVPVWSWADRRLIMIPLPQPGNQQIIVRGGGGGGGSGEGGTTNHAALLNLDYASAGHTGFEPAGAGVAAVAAHVGESDPHTQYLLEADYTAGVSDHALLTHLDYASSGHTGFEASGTAAAAISTHVGLSDPHTQYALESALGTMAAATETDYLRADGTRTGASSQAQTFTNGIVTTSGASVFNENGADVDFRVEGDTQQQLLFVNAGDDTVHMGGGGTTQGPRLFVYNDVNTVGSLKSAIRAQLLLADNTAWNQTASALDVLLFLDGTVAYTNTQSALAFTITVNGPTTVADLRPVSGTTGISGATNVTNVSLSFLVLNHQGTGTITNAYGSRAHLRALNASAVITNAYNFYVDAPTLTGTISNFYGFYLPNSTYPASSWGVYIAEPDIANYFAGKVGIGTTTPVTLHDVADINAGTGAVQNAVTMRSTNSGTPGAGFGVGFRAGLKSSTTADQDAGRLTYEWVTATHASRASRGKLTAYYTSTEQEAMRWDGDTGGLKLGFYGVAAVARQVLATGAGATVDDVITALQALGLVKQS